MGVFMTRASAEDFVAADPVMFQRSISAELKQPFARRMSAIRQAGRDDRSARLPTEERDTGTESRCPDLGGCDRVWFQRWISAESKRPFVHRKSANLLAVRGGRSDLRAAAEWPMETESRCPARGSFARRGSDRHTRG